jgi:hypothetical protein
MKNEIRDLKKRITESFKTLRKAGYFARQHFWCCQGCGWAAVPSEKADKVVFYHKQDTDTLRERGYVYLAWSGDGDFLKQTFETVGINVEWDGSTSTRIKLSV